MLLLGSGGRESALASGLARSPSVSDLIAAPGNPGIARLASVVPAEITDPATVVDLARSHAADLVVVGPEAPLVAGVADALDDAGIAVFGPRAAAARIEGSKSHAKRLMEGAGIPTATAVTFDDAARAVGYLDTIPPPYVVKADGLAAGKGVVVTEDRSEAVEAIHDRMTRGVFGEAGRTVVIEEFLDGPEASVIALTDGETILSCEPAQDFKRALDGDLGPNTGGMGSYSPVPACPPDLVTGIEVTVLQPMVAATAHDSPPAPFSGALYAGLALTSRGPRVIEFNVRWGDPETQALIPRLRSDLGELFMACARRELAGMTMEWAPQACVSVVLASEGYPGEPVTGREIDGLADAAAVEGVEVFQAGTVLENGRLITSGGRVLAISALGVTLASAREAAYRAVRKISFEGCHFRTDIALAASGEGLDTEEGLN